MAYNKLRNHNCNFFFLLFKCTALFLVCLWIQQKAPLFLNQETSIRYDDYYTLDKNCKLCTVREAFPFFLQKLREGLLFIIFQYVFKMFSLLAVPGQVIPGGSESPFRAAGLRQCRAWNPITSAAMLALWHQTPSMQNATAGVYQQRAPQFSSCRGVHWWVARLTRGRRDDTVDTDEGQSGEQKKGVGVRVRTVEWGEKMLSLGCTSIVTAACGLYHRGEHSKGRSNWRGWDKNQYLTTKNYCEWAGAPKCIT